jgi:hypothetical protein
MTVVRSLAVVGGKATDRAAELLEQGREALLGDPMETTKGSGARMQFGEWGRAVIWAPYHMPNYPLRWAPYLITLFHTFVLATVMGLVVPVVASTFTSVITGLNGLGIAIVTAAIILLGMSVRSADHLPQFMAPFLVFAEWIHGHIGVVVALPMIALMLAGSALDAPILTGLGGTFLPNYATAVRPVSYWGAVALQTSLVAFMVYMFQFNTPVKHYHLAQVRPPQRQRAEDPFSPCFHR